MVADAPHGPTVALERGGSQKGKAICFAIEDDHSRLICGARFEVAETELRLECTLRAALEARGVPERLYVDNGAPFASGQLPRICAHLGIRLIHSGLGRPEGRGKIERFFRTLRGQFLVEAVRREDLSLPDLNRMLDARLERVYHRREHSETGAPRPSGSSPRSRFGARAPRSCARRSSGLRAALPLPLRRAAVLRADRTRVAPGDGARADRRVAALPPSAAPCKQRTAARTLELFAGLARHRLIRDRQLVQTFQPDLTPLQAQLLELLGVSATGRLSRSSWNLRWRSSRLVRSGWERFWAVEVHYETGGTTVKKVLVDEVAPAPAGAGAGELPERVQEALGELAGAAKEGLLALSVGVGLGVLGELMAEEVDAVVGPKGKHNAERAAVRHGHGAACSASRGTRCPRRCGSHGSFLASTKPRGRMTRSVSVTSASAWPSVARHADDKVVGVADEPVVRLTVTSALLARRVSPIVSHARV